MLNCYSALNSEYARLKEVMESYRQRKQCYMKQAAHNWRNDLLVQHGVGHVFSCRTVTTLAHAIQLTIGYNYRSYRYTGRDEYDDLACTHAVEALRAYLKPFGFRLLIGSTNGELTTVTIKKGSLTLCVTSTNGELAPPQEEIDKASKKWEEEFEESLDEQTKRDVYNYKHWGIYPFGPKI